LEAHAVGSGEGGGSGALAVGGDQVGGVAIIEAVAQGPRTLRARLRGTHRAGEGCGGKAVGQRLALSASKR
jgi:hypothetical protein